MTLTINFSIGELQRMDGQKFPNDCSNPFAAKVNYIPTSDLFFWNLILPSKSIKSWNFPQTKMNIENGSVNTLKFVICFHFQVMPL